MTPDDMAGRTRALAAWLDSSTHEPWAFSSAQAAADLRALLLDYQERGRALKDLLDHVDRITCQHDDTHRGGVIWTICDGCGRKWADDEGGFVPYKDAPAVAIARATLKGKSHD